MARKIESQIPGTIGKQPTTRWVNLQKINAVPLVLKSVDYKPYHRVDFSSHTRLVPSAQNMVDQLDRSGGGFYIELKPSNAGWIGWADLGKLGVELVDLRCAVCMERVPVNPQLVANHFRVHKSILGKPRKGGAFYLTISKNAPAATDPDEADADIYVGELE